ncbi:hypothetical protein TCAL_15654 [Tigriopus californicus]|uniref:CCHC-type domain-containing protein n=1 Tax=Tigriopus californicus TaxID=6832 RepID=A0A553P9Y5_TIGCA|nr:hypothetical protein TCAL_15654 [Tigriopus californicus]
MRNYRGNSEPPNSCDSDDSDYHDRTTGLRRSGFPIKISGIAMGSQESLNSGEESGPALWEHALNKRRSVRSLKGASGSKMPMESANYGPFGFGMLTNMQKSKRGLGCNYSSARTKRSSSINNLVNAVEQSQEIGREDLPNTNHNNDNDNDNNNSTRHCSSNVSTRERQSSKYEISTSVLDHGEHDVAQNSQSIDFENFERRFVEPMQNLAFGAGGTVSEEISNIPRKQASEATIRTRNPSEDHLPKLEAMDQIRSSCMFQANNGYCDQADPTQRFQSIDQRSEKSNHTSSQVETSMVNKSDRCSWNTYSQSSESKEQFISHMDEHHSTTQIEGAKEMRSVHGSKSFENEIHTNLEQFSSVGNCSYESQTCDQEYKYLEELSDFSRKQESTSVEYVSSYEKSSCNEMVQETQNVARTQGKRQQQQQAQSSSQKSEIISITLQSREMNQFQQQELAKVLSQEASKVFRSKSKDSPETTTENDLTSPPPNCRQSPVPQDPPISSSCQEEPLPQRLSVKGRSSSSSHRSFDSKDDTQIQSESQGKHIPPPVPTTFCQQIDLGLNTDQLLVNNIENVFDDDDDNDEVQEVNPGDVNIHEPMIIQPLSNTPDQPRTMLFDEVTFPDEEANLPLPPYPELDQNQDMLQDVKHDILPRERLTVSKDECLIFDDLFEKLVDDEASDEDLKVKTRPSVSNSSYRESTVHESTFQESIGQRGLTSQRESNVQNSNTDEFGTNEPAVQKEAETKVEDPYTEMTSTGSFYRTDDVSEDCTQFTQTTESILLSYGFQREHDTLEKFIQPDSTESKDEDLTFFQLKDRFESSSSKLKEKRQRNLTIDYHDLAPSTWKWNGQIAKHVQGTCDSKDPLNSQKNNEQSIEGDGHHVDSLEEGLGQGLGIILDKLRNIETKLDEIKTMEQNIWYPELDMPTKESYLPEVGQTPTATLAFNKNDDKRSSVDPTWPDKDLDAISLCSNDQTSQTLIAHNGLENEDNEDALSVADTIPADDILENANVIVTTPETVRASPMKEFAKFAVDISSLATSDDEEDTTTERNARIEELAKKIMAEKQQLQKIESQERQLAHAKDDLDTVSEGSEDEDEDHKVSERKFQNIGITIRRRRTRSASRDRSLAKIRYCWRCHQTGHENFDCTAELHPGNWCPRCLENTHWEDGCWVNEQQIFCTICTLPGHLPCVHETSDFRQRKLIVETFGWLAFKDWFREPDFWSWWNISGYTNVPLYKLMQHNRTKDE